MKKVKGKLERGGLVIGEDGVDRLFLSIPPSLHRKLTLSNIGGREGHFEIFCPPISSGASFGVSPAAGTLAAGEEISLRFEILTNEQKSLKETVKIRVVGTKVRSKARDAPRPRNRNRAYRPMQWTDGPNVFIFSLCHYVI